MTMFLRFVFLFSLALYLPHAAGRERWFVAGVFMGLLVELLRHLKPDADEPTDGHE